MDAVFKALAAPVRRDILALVRDEERSAGDIAARFALTRPAISQHLTALKAAGLLEERRLGTSRRYRLRKEGLHVVRALLDELAGAQPPPRRAPPRAEAGPLERRLSLPVRPQVAFAWLADDDRVSLVAPPRALGAARARSAAAPRV